MSAPALAVFLAGSAAIVALSWRSLRRPASHGFSRFFAFEALLALLLLNLPSWFAAPLAPRQLASWALLFGSIPLAVNGFQALRARGRPSPGAGGEAELGWERTTRLVESGAYRFIRHPLYASLLLLAWGAALKRPAPAAVALALAATVALWATAKADERECVERFGTAYREYAARTRMFVPFLF